MTTTHTEEPLSPPPKRRAVQGRPAEEVQSQKLEKMFGMMIQKLNNMDQKTEGRLTETEQRLDNTEQGLIVAERKTDSIPASLQVNPGPITAEAILKSPMLTLRNPQ